MHWLDLVVGLLSAPPLMTLLTMVIVKAWPHSRAAAAAVVYLNALPSQVQAVQAARAPNLTPEEKMQRLLNAGLAFEVALELATKAAATTKPAEQAP